MEVIGKQEAVVRDKEPESLQTRLEPESAALDGEEFPTAEDWKEREQNPPADLQALIARLEDVFSEKRAARVNVEYVQRLMSAYVSDRADWEQYAKFDRYRCAQCSPVLFSVWFALLSTLSGGPFWLKHMLPSVCECGSQHCSICKTKIRITLSQYVIRTSYETVHRRCNRYTRNLVSEGNGRFNLILLCWGEGHSSSIHDHAHAHCFMKMLLGAPHLYRFYDHLPHIFPRAFPSRSPQPLVWAAFSYSKFHFVHSIRVKLV